MEKKLAWPSRCQMCELAEESNFHMFFQCNSILRIWQNPAFLYGFPLISHASTQATFAWWGRQRESWRPIFVTALWCAWSWRNNKNFNDAKVPLMDITQNISLLLGSVPKKSPKMKKSNRNGLPDPLLRPPMAFLMALPNEILAAVGFL